MIIITGLCYLLDGAWIDKTKRFKKVGSVIAREIMKLQGLKIAQSQRDSSNTR